MNKLSLFLLVGLLGSSSASFGMYLSQTDIEMAVEEGVRNALLYPDGRPAPPPYVYTPLPPRSPFRQCLDDCCMSLSDYCDDVRSPVVLLCGATVGMIVFLLLMLPSTS